ncbi:MAG: N-acetyltransferase [Rhodobacteraceae bacterium]|nr:N-acetyltransferase [Paracoccaceae bacterium]
MIRKARREDARTIANFWNPFIRDTMVTFNTVEKSVGDIVRLIAERPVFLVAELASEPVGFATFAQFRAGIGYKNSMEHTIILAPNAQGSGVGRALMHALEQQAKAAGTHVLVAGICAENLPGIAFHKACGYVQTGHLPSVGRKFGRWHDLILMQKILADGA